MLLHCLRLVNMLDMADAPCPAAPPTLPAPPSQMGAQWADLKPTSLWRSEVEDWWGVQIQIPEQAVDVQFCFTDGANNWDSNGGNNYSAQIASAAKAESAADAEAARLIRPRSIEKEERLDHAGGEGQRGGGAGEASVRWSGLGRSAWW